MSDQPIQALVFDFGSVFTLSEGSRDRLRAYDAQLGLARDSLHTLLCSGEAWEMASTGRITLAEYWDRTGAQYEPVLPPGFCAFRQGLFWAEPINEEMVALAAALRLSYRLALCSNTLPELEGILDRRPDIRDLFEVRVMSVRAGVRKPDPRIFELTAQRLGLPLGACLLIDDKPRNTQAARALGMAAIVFQSVRQLHSELKARGLFD